MSMLTWVMAGRCPSCFSKASTNCFHVSLSLPIAGKHHTPGHQVGEHTDAFMALAHTHLIDVDTADVAEVRLGISRAHLPEEHPPQPRVRLADQFGHPAHGHLAHEQEGKGFKLLGEMRAQPLPGRAHPEDAAAVAALAAGQPAGVIWQRCWNTLRCRRVSVSVWS